MKQMTCRQLGGACDTIITGSTPAEMAVNSKNHVMELKAKGDTSHDEAMAKMGKMTPEEHQAFMADFFKRFGEAPEVTLT